MSYNDHVAFITSVAVMLSITNLRRFYRPAVQQRRKSSVVTCVLTGGPCGGKSSSMSDLTMSLKNHGYHVFTCPEVPTILMQNGCVFPGLSIPRHLLFTVLPWLSLYLPPNSIPYSFRSEWTSSYSTRIRNKFDTTSIVHGIHVYRHGCINEQRILTTIGHPL